jgi:hypothetical protein
LRSIDAEATVSRHGCYCVQVPETSRTDWTRTLGDAVMPLAAAPDIEPVVGEVVSLVEPVVPLVEPEGVLDVSGVVEVDEPLVPIEELLDESSVPVTWTFLPTCFESLSLSLEISL